jgi:hypothetical protein
VVDVFLLLEEEFNRVREEKLRGETELMSRTALTTGKTGL